MISFRFIPERTAIPVLRFERLGFAISGALIALLVGGAVIHGGTVAMVWGVPAGPCSTTVIATPPLL